MNSETPYNPLDKTNLGVSVSDALLESAVNLLGGIEPFIGAGIYAIYYTGDYPPYVLIARDNVREKFSAPIYVGKAVPPGARKGGFGLDSDPGQVLFKRLNEHATSIEQVSNLDISDFHVRLLVVDDIWIPLGESLLIEKFSPLWNKFVDGFGNHDPGSGRYNQKRSLWDTLHEGRSWALKCRANEKPVKTIIKEIEKYFESK